MPVRLATMRSEISLILLGVDALGVIPFVKWHSLSIDTDTGGNHVGEKLCSIVFKDRQASDIPIPKRNLRSIDSCLRSIAMPIGRLHSAVVIGFAIKYAWQRESSLHFAVPLLLALAFFTISCLYISFAHRDLDLTDSDWADQLRILKALH